MANEPKNRLEVSIVDELQALADQTRQLAKRAEELVKSFHSARGTKKIKAIKRAPAPRQPIDMVLFEKVLALVKDRPISLRELVEATGVTDDDKIKVCTTKMQRDGMGLVNIGAQNKALWYIPPKGALARLRKGGEGGGDDDDEDED